MLELLGHERALAMQFVAGALIIGCDVGANQTVATVRVPLRVQCRHADSETRRLHKFDAGANHLIPVVVRGTATVCQVGNLLSCSS